MISAGLRPAPIGRRAARGVSLIELLVAMTTGLVLLGGALTAYLKARDAYATLETTARLQEIALYALGLIESDVRMGGFLGLTRRPELVTNLDGPLTDAAGERLALAGCTGHWVTGLARPLHGWDQSGDADGSIPGDFAQRDPPDAPPLADTRRLLVHAYYVSTDSSAAVGYPSLRRKRLVSGPAVQDEEIIPGVEDLQVQYGVDNDGDGSADRYVDADGLEAGTTIVSARLWLRIRAAERDPAWNDTTHYAYAKQDERVPAAERAFRRVVVSRTIHLRNARDS